MALPVENTKILEFLELVGRLKHVKRTGWVICDINECESIAGHMYRMGMMTFLLTDQNNTTNLDRFKCLQIALVHDLAECIVGDITPHCGVSPEEKHRQEDEAMKKIAELTGMAGDRMYELYKEYEFQSSPEAQFAKDLDRYDMILQAFEYEKREKAPRKLQEFFTATEGKFKHPFIQGLVKELYKQREEFESKVMVNGNA
ncbi:5'-deoxynucleotidase HDDC2 [Amyelois transitella]|uniref:5'-deoxynucleotidase HDDC2 n=1 Tax=Amyelois transitella TaxID=680683 RepID=UPI00067CB3C1|nr:5'-deoxynucleotidase HDDC2 [Amyelois transitella]XP_013197074.1 5'-deoxynucleotidase HDDC2 [Amyelois transitella]XP_013197075.1 5'-deoxynucleotidase HDDC2 [Amyelois transitella]